MDSIEPLHDAQFAVVALLLLRAGAPQRGEILQDDLGRLRLAGPGLAADEVLWDRPCKPFRASRFGLWRP